MASNHPQNLSLKKVILKKVVRWIVRSVWISSSFFSLLLFSSRLRKFPSNLNVSTFVVCNYSVIAMNIVERSFLFARCNFSFPFLQPLWIHIQNVKVRVFLFIAAFLFLSLFLGKKIQIKSHFNFEHKSIEKMGQTRGSK